MVKDWRSPSGETWEKRAKGNGDRLPESDHRWWIWVRSGVERVELGRVGEVGNGPLLNL